MKAIFTKACLALGVILAAGVSNTTLAQTCEWRLTGATYDASDPDGAGPATGSVSFILQVRTAVAGTTVPNVNAISIGYSYDSLKAMIPTSPAGPGCPSTVSNPQNVLVSPFFLSGGFAYTTVNQCGVFPQSAGGEPMNKRAVGTMDGTSVTITNTWQDMFTVTLWSLGNSFPQGGYVALNSGEGGSPAPFNSYAISDDQANGYVTNSLTFTTPLALGGTVPVLFTKFGAQCNSNGTLVSWATAQEANSSKFEVERSLNGTDWKSVATVSAAGSSNSERNYQQLDLNGGSAFYRIKQIDKDGNFIYTGTERTNCITKTITSVIYPVPARDELTVVIKSDRAINTRLMVFDIAGKVVKEVRASVLNGNNTFKVNLMGLTSGDYIIKSSDASVDLNKVFTIAR